VAISTPDYQSDHIKFYGRIFMIASRNTHSENNFALHFNVGRFAQIEAVILLNKIYNKMHFPIDKPSEDLNCPVNRAFSDWRIKTSTTSYPQFESLPAPATSCILVKEIKWCLCFCRCKLV
jgi:hypothetical protein